MQDNGDDLVASSSQPAASVPSAAVAEQPVDLGRITSPSAIQGALLTARVNRQQEAGSDQDPNFKFNYEGDSSDEISQVPAEIKNVITPVAAIQNNITPSAEFQSNLASEAAEIQRDLIPAVAEF
jgi:hypothetical protein